jgi:hypothetical protein
MVRSNRHRALADCCYCGIHGWRLAKLDGGRSDCHRGVLERTLTYNRIVNAPTSFIGHDDLEMYERAQNGLHAPGNLWVNTQRLYAPAEQNTGHGVTNGTTEWQIRNQHRAWVKYMTMSM